MKFNNIFQETLDSMMNDIKNLDKSNQQQDITAQPQNSNTQPQVDKQQSQPIQFTIGNWKGNSRVKALMCGDKLVLLAYYVKGVNSLVNVFNQLGGAEKIYSLLPEESKQNLTPNDLKSFKPIK